MRAWSTAERLVLADRLMGEADPRGEFIALQCWLEEPSSDVAAWSRSRLRSEQLLARHRHEWTKDLLAACEDDMGRYIGVKAIFRRGFVERLQLYRASAGLGGWLAEHTVIDSIRIAQEGLENLIGTPFWTQVRRVQCTGSTLHEVLTPENTAHLTVLNLNESNAVRNLTALVGLPLPAVQEIGLRGLGLSARSLGKLQEATWLPTLRALDVGATRLDAAGLSALTERAVGLRTLRMHSLPALSTHLDAWADRRAWEELSLRSSVGGKDVAVLTGFDTSALHTLDLSSPTHPLGPKEIATLASSWTLPAMRRLTMSNTRMGDGPLGVLAKAGWFAGTHTLVLRSNSLKTPGLAALLEADPPCSTLDLSSNQLDDDALAMLASWPGLARVADLDLSQNRKVSADGLHTLLDSPHLNAVRLAVEGLGSDARCVERLASRPG